MKTKIARQSFRQIKAASISVAMVLILCGISYTSWHLYRTWNYSMGYESMVEKTVCDMVKPEYLKKPCD
jgi:hypothetical protein